MNSGESALIERQSRFDYQIETHKGILFKVVSTFSWSKEDQQDLAQEITVQLWKGFSKFDHRRVFSTWMYQVALNTAISWSRKAKHRNRQVSWTEEAAEIPEPRVDESDSEMLYRLIDSLDELSRALLMLYIEEKSHSEIGEILGITPNNVAIKLNRIKKRLRMEAEQQN